MHAGFPRFTNEINQAMQRGLKDDDVTRFFEQAGGRLLAKGMATLLKLGFGFVMRDSLLSEEQSQKALAFFNDNFVISDPDAEGGRKYYQGKFLIRTRKPDDDMNVWLKFCPEPEELFKETASGKELHPLAVVSTEALSEEEAERIEIDPDQVDLVIRFKDSQSIVGLLGRPDVDMVGLLLENLVQMTGNVGHLFKIGAIAANLERALDLPKP
jgi:hypothetical protein